MAKVLLSDVLSHTPGNFLAEYTVNAALKQDAKIGALPLITVDCCPGMELGFPTLMKENLSLQLG